MKRPDRRTFTFRATEGQSARLRLDFSAIGQADIDLLDEPRRDILLHLSFRIGPRKLMVNRRLDGTWQKPEAIALDAMAAGAVVDLTIVRGQAELRLDGAKLAQDALAPIELAEGAWLAVNAGIASVALDGPDHAARKARGELRRAGPFALGGFAFDPGSEAHDVVARLRRPDGASPALPCATCVNPASAEAEAAPREDIRLLVRLPGWIWAEVPPEDDNVVVDLMVNGRPADASVEVTRASVLSALEAAGRRPLQAGAHDAVQAIDHARWPAHWAALGPAAQTGLRRLARRYGLQALLPAEVAPPSTGLPPTPAALKGIARGLAPHPPAAWGDVLRTVIPGLSPDTQRAALLGIAGPFCSADRFEDLRAVAQEHGLTRAEPGQGVWTVMPALPYLADDGRIDEMIPALRSLPGTAHGLDPATLGWAIRHVLERRPLVGTPDTRAALVEATLDLIEADDTDDVRTYLPPMPRMAAAILFESATFRAGQRDAIRARVLHHYRHAPALAEALRRAAARRGQTLDPALDGWTAQIERCNAALDRAALGDASEALPPVPDDPERAAVRLALSQSALAAAPFPGAEPSSPPFAGAAAMTTDGTPGVDLVRRAAHPLAPPLPETAASQVREAVRRARTPRDPGSTPDLAAEAMHAARALLAGQDVAPDRFLDHARVLGGDAHEYLGAGLALSVLAAARAGERHDLLDALAAPVHEMLVEGGLALTAMPAPRAALWRLAETARRAPSPFLDRVLAAWPAVRQDLPPAPSRAPLLAPRTPLAHLADILVVIVSQEADRATRVAALRAAWLDRLSGLGVSWIVATGGGEAGTTLDGQHLRLPAPDAGDPIGKTLALLDWLRRCSTHAHVMLLNDDCALDIDAALGGKLYARFDYWGRVVSAEPGTPSRLLAEHGPTSPVRDAARLRLDASPEAGAYADGRTGYTLSRSALIGLADMAQTRHGAWLRLMSGHGDKIVGDLLAAQGIRPSGRDFDAMLLRPSRPGGLPTLREGSGYHPGRAAPSLVAALDDPERLPEAARIASTTALRPARLWPIQPNGRHTADTGAVVLVSPPERLRAVNSADLCVVGSLRNERQMAPMFLEHYRRLGTAGFLLVDNGSDDGTLEFLATQPDVAVFSCDQPYSQSRYGVDWQLAVLANLRGGRWSLVADTDEFLMLPEGTADLGALTRGLEEGADAVRVFMLDMYPAGPLAAATLTSGDPFDDLTHVDRTPFLNASSPAGELETWTSALRHRLMPDARRDLFVAQKYALIRYKPWMRFTAGLHFAANVHVARRDLIFAHFKYHAGFHARAEAETARGEHFNAAEEYRKYVELMRAGTLTLHDPGVSIPWQSCDWVRARLGLA